ncbi:uncharacterized protein LOC108806633 [Raphanus sativus]|uniref:Uncharacterized protein LOC108806633 n=1 Tax=Raphanus sativus TaxID=3726 RepID=A0A6J0JF97_RAPSA|nr:uncharacterized protein LOC108806633 [Raphanus sativus]
MCLNLKNSLCLSLVGNSEASKMGRTCTEDEETLLISHRNQVQENEEEDEDEEEALSLSDLPVNSSNVKVHFPKQSKSEEEEEEIDSGFEFEIGSSFRLGSDSCEPAPEMSTADELFSEGRILPLRHSVSLDAGSNRLITRSESVEFRRTRAGSDRKIKNNFIDYSQPSPNPQIIRRSSSMTARVSSIRNPKSSSIWDFLRLGLVRTPEIELRTPANARVSVSRNSSCSSTSTSSNSKKTGGESRSRSRRKSFLFADCKCSAATETVVPVKMKINEAEEKQRRKKTAKKEEKTAFARKRTFEWLKELSQVGSVVDPGRRSLA